MKSPKKQHTPQFVIPKALIADLKKMAAFKIWRHMTRKKIIFSLLDEGSQKVLDVGCSIGDFGLELALRGNQTLGIDINAEEIGIARKLATDFKADTAAFEVGDFFKKDFSNDKFDGVLLCEIVEHFYNPELLLEKSFSLLKEGGWVIVSIPNIASLRNRLVLFIRGVFPDNQIFHHYYFTKADLLEKIWISKHFQSKNILVKPEEINQIHPI